MSRIINGINVSYDYSDMINNILKNDGNSDFYAVIKRDNNKTYQAIVDYKLLNTDSLKIAKKQRDSFYINWEVALIKDILEELYELNSII